MYLCDFAMVAEKKARLDISCQTKLLRCGWGCSPHSVLTVPKQWLHRLIVWMLVLLLLSKAPQSHILWLRKLTSWGLWATPWMSHEQRRWIHVGRDGTAYHPHIHSFIHPQTIPAAQPKLSGC